MSSLAQQRDKRNYQLHLLYTRQVRKTAPSGRHGEVDAGPAFESTAAGAACPSHRSLRSA